MVRLHARLWLAWGLVAAALASVGGVVGAPMLTDGGSRVSAAVDEDRLVERDCDTAPALEPMRCYWLEVPERRDVPGAGTIRLWVAVMGEADPGIPAIVDIPGGPGQTASTWWVSGDPIFPVVRERVTILIDPRGVGRSEPRLSCPPFDGVLPPTAPWEARVAQQRLLQASCRQRLSKAGVDLDGYDSVEVAADYVALRRALGIDRWVIRTGSYGSRYAREVYRQDPDGVEAMVMFTSQTTAPAGPATMINRAARAVERITAACDAQPACAAHGDFASNLTTAAARLDASPFELPGGGVIDGGLVYYGLFYALYQPELIPLLPAVGAQLAAGDTSILPAMADVINPTPPDDERDVQSDVVLLVVLCADEGAALTDADHAVLANPGVWEDVVGPGGWHCDVWDVDPVPGGRLKPVAGDIPVLVVSGGLDPATPPETADEVIAGFLNTTSLVLPAAGHAGGVLVDCTRVLSVAFILDPTADLDTSCVDELPQPFTEP
jgi:pimeloyl-ACP methyl ester carboxylesterase